MYELGPKKERDVWTFDKRQKRCMNKKKKDVWSLDQKKGDA